MTADNQSNDTEENAVDNNDVKASAEQQKEPVKGPGQILKEARERKNLSQREVADRLRLRLQIIELLEKDEYDSFSTPTFIKGYLRSYAKLLDVNEQEVFAAYRKLGIKEPDTSAMQSFSRRVKHEENDNRLMLITYAVIIVVIGLVIWWWQDSDLSFNSISDDVQQAVTETEVQESPEPQQQTPTQQQQPRERQDDQEPLLESEVEADDVSTSLTANDPNESTTDQSVTVSETEQPETTLAAVNEPAPESAASDEPAVDGEQPATVTDDTANESELAEVNEPSPAAASEADEDEPVAEQQPSEAVTASLVFQFSEECWVKVDDANGETQAVGIKAAGYTMQVPGEAPFSITVCKPEAVTITYQGETVDLSSFRQSRVARLTVPATN